VRLVNNPGAGLPHPVLQVTDSLCDGRWSGWPPAQAADTDGGAD